ncbi:hypothetical protein Lepto7375DRAFT_5671 [Leptolyngbya sp. PCC 7375]|nr:hypothetical protein Lepto7375DRAFT_5671 [Leptolyngbya sp. PCC 7375]
MGLGKASRNRAADRRSAHLVLDEIPYEKYSKKLVQKLVHDFSIILKTLLEEEFSL